MAAFFFLFFAVFSLFASISAVNTCYAPPLFYGPKCNSSTAILGSPEWKITYRIEQANNLLMLICCKGLGCGPLDSSNCGVWKWYDLGCSITSIQGALPWGNNTAYPSIQCYGSPLEITLTWELIESDPH